MALALHNTRLVHMALSCEVGGNVATGLLKISPDFLSKKKLEKETKYQSVTSSTVWINSLMTWKTIEMHSVQPLAALLKKSSEQTTNITYNTIQLTSAAKNQNDQAERKRRQGVSKTMAKVDKCLPVKNMEGAEEDLHCNQLCSSFRAIKVLSFL